MELALTGLSLPLRIRPSVPMTDDELMAFCAKNELVSVERDADGELIVMSSSGTETASSNSELNFELVLWNRHVGRGIVFDSNAGSLFLMGRCVRPMLLGYRLRSGPPSRRRTKHGLRRSALSL